MKALMSSTTDLWETPKWLFDELNKISHVGGKTGEGTAP